MPKDLLGFQDLFEERLRAAYNLTGSFRAVGRLLGISKDTANKYISRISKGEDLKVPDRFRERFAFSEPKPEIGKRELQRVAQQAIKDAGGSKRVAASRLGLSPQQFGKMQKGSLYKKPSSIIKAAERFEETRKTRKNAEPIKTMKGKKAIIRTFDPNDGNIPTKQRAQYQAVLKGKLNGKSRTFTTSLFGSPEEALASLNRTMKKYRNDEVSTDELYIKELDYTQQTY